MRSMVFVGMATAIAFLGACSLPGRGEEELWGDISAPEVLAESVDEAGVLVLDFNEDVELDEAELRSTTGSKPQVRTGKGKRLEVDTSPGAKAGKPYKVALSARDRDGNSTSVIVPLYGPNPVLPRVLISELVTSSSSKLSDMVELRVLEDGNLAGLTLLLGTLENHDAVYQFPPIAVRAGDYILVHCKRENTDGEIDEVDDWSLASGKGAVAGVLDVWLPDSPGLPDSSGVVSLMRNPGGGWLDAVFYTDKLTEPDKDYDSFGTRKLQERVQELVRAGAWQIAGESLKVEDGASSQGITATRTLCRRPGVEDSNRKEDWQIVATGQASPGRDNSALAWQP